MQPIIYRPFYKNPNKVCLPIICGLVFGITQIADVPEYIFVSYYPGVFIFCIISAIIEHERPLEIAGMPLLAVIICMPFYEPYICDCERGDLIAFTLFVALGGSFIGAAIKQTSLKIKNAQPVAQRDVEDGAR